MMGAIARGERALLDLASRDVLDIETANTISQLIGDLKHEQREHEKTRDLLRLVERSSDATIEQRRAELRANAGAEDAYAFALLKIATGSIPYNTATDDPEQRALNWVKAHRDFARSALFPEREL